MQNFLRHSSRHSRSRLKKPVHIIPSTGGVKDYCVKILRKIMLKFRDRVFAKIETGFETGLNCANSLENGLYSSNLGLLMLVLVLSETGFQYGQKQKIQSQQKNILIIRRRMQALKPHRLRFFFFKKRENQIRNPGRVIRKLLDNRQGISLFNDDFTGQNVTITTELIYHSKYKIVQLPAPRMEVGEVRCAIRTE